MCEKKNNKNFEANNIQGKKNIAVRECSVRVSHEKRANFDSSCVALRCLRVHWCACALSLCWTVITQQTTTKTKRFSRATKSQKKKSDTASGLCVSIFRVVFLVLSYVCFWECDFVVNLRDVFAISCLCGLCVGKQDRGRSNPITRGSYSGNLIQQRQQQWIRCTID